jgi:uncharacterized membrane protein YccC
MNELEKQIWKASRGVPEATATLLTKLFAERDRIDAELAAAKASAEAPDGRKVHKWQSTTMRS